MFFGDRGKKPVSKFSNFHVSSSTGISSSQRLPPISMDERQTYCLTSSFHLSTHFYRHHPSTIDLSQPYIDPCLLIDRYIPIDHWSFGRSRWSAGKTPRNRRRITLPAPISLALPRRSTIRETCSPGGPGLDRTDNGRRSVIRPPPPPTPPYPMYPLRSYQVSQSVVVRLDIDLDRQLETWCGHVSWIERGVYVSLSKARPGPLCDEHAHRKNVYFVWLLIFHLAAVVLGLSVLLGSM